MSKMVAKKERNKKTCVNCAKVFYSWQSDERKYCTKKCQYENMQGTNHPNWKGDNASYSAIHKWLNQQNAKKDACKFCGDKKNLHLALKEDKEHKRDASHYLTLCALCHTDYDNTEEKSQKRRENILNTYAHQNRIKDLPKVKCPICGEMFRREKTRQKICSRKCVRKKAGAVAKAKSNSVVQYTIEGKKVAEYESVIKASEEIGSCTSAIAKACKGTNNTSHGYVWEYKKKQHTTLTDIKNHLTNK